MQLVFDNPNCKVYLDNTIAALQVVWSGFVTGSVLREAHEATLDLMRAHHTWQVLADTREMRVIPRAEQQWIQEDYFPRALAAGYRRAAILTSADIFNQVSVKNILQSVTAEHVFEAQYFQTMPEARGWLQQYRPH